MSREIRTKKGARISFVERPGDPPDFVFNVKGEEDALGRRVHFNVVLTPENVRDLITEMSEVYTASGEAGLSLSESDKFTRMLKQALNDALDDRERASRERAFQMSLHPSTWLGRRQIGSHGL